MKNIIFILLLVFVVSCSNKDEINHYLNKKVTELELVKNGFYKYPFADTIVNEDDIDGPIGTVFKYELYSNVKPQKQDDGRLYPVALFKSSRHQDKKQRAEKLRYINDELDSRIISYLFINDTLDFKTIYVYSLNKDKKQIADFTTEKGILNYYKNQKVPFKQRLGGIKYGKMEFPYRFRINNYETGIYVLKYHDATSYQMVTTYENVKENEETVYDFRHINPDNVKDWYSGHTYELSK
jgi:hypothetical protein